MAAIRTERFKYVHFAELSPVLYDLSADPGESRNIAADPPPPGC
jgi:arylsulfatase A-like enzyme